MGSGGHSSGEYYDCVLCDRCVMSDAQIENSGGII
jgi:hypothetical protein